MVNGRDEAEFRSLSDDQSICTGYATAIPGTNYLPVEHWLANRIGRRLTSLGAAVKSVVAYRTITPNGAAKQARAALERGVDATTFTSSSTVRNLLKMLDGDRRGLECSTIACIGPATADTARELGLRVDMVAETHNVQGLVDALVAHFSGKQQEMKGNG